MKKTFLFCGLFVSFVFLTGCQGQKKVDLADYLKVSFDGANGYGTVSANLDGDKVMKTLYGEDTVADPETFVMSLDEEKQRLLKTQASSLKNAEIKINKEKDLSNGDKIIVTVNARNVDEFVNGSKEFEVKGLKEVPEKIQDVSNFDELKKEIDDYFIKYCLKSNDGYSIDKECLMYNEHSDSFSYGKLKKLYSLVNKTTNDKEYRYMYVDNIYMKDNKAFFEIKGDFSMNESFDEYFQSLKNEGYKKVE
ncbi:hypothetical protein [Enterococcus hirae]|uniref:hypothetical protein n=1 Tax=Enterococcus hirae TaxID=1354 RepID=UPI001A973315|nr:hypothetical protein [Enterococcus hirae]MBO1103617.1 hypothetical protein [Enterococcus hirae]